jgi:elongation factor 1-gamma
MHTGLVERQTRSLKTLELHISTRTFFVGERITLADLYIASVIQKAVGKTVDAALRTELPNLVRHLETIVNQPQLKEIYGETDYVEKAIQFVPPAKEKKEKEPKPAAAAAAPKAEKKPKAKDDEEEDDLVPAEPKVKNPLDDLPKSTFNLEDWKRAYSNKETRGAGGALEWFYEKYVSFLSYPHAYLTLLLASTTKDFPLGVSISNTTMS